MKVSNPLTLSPSITCFPILHGKGAVCQELRKLLWDTPYDCIAVAFPERLQDDLQEGIEKLPIIHAVCLRIDDETAAFAPIDPCDAFIEALRQGMQRRIPVRFIEDDTLLLHQEFLTLPDPYLLKSIGMAKYYQLCAPYLKEVAEDEILRHRAWVTLSKLRGLESEHKRILFLCDFPLMVSIDALPGLISEKITALEGLLPASQLRELASPHLISTHMFPIKPDHLYFALGEIPFYTGELEKERLNPLTSPPDYLELVKKIFIETRKNYISKDRPGDTLSITRLQVALQYLRNLSVIDGSLLPGLFDIVTVAKGVFGPYFATKVLEAAKYYPFFNLARDDESLHVGIERVQTPLDDEPVEAIHLLQDEPKEWRSIQLKKEPNPEQQKKYRYLWDPSGMCSHLPEDLRIEGFNQTVRRRALQIQAEGQARSEKFTSSMKDGIDIRRTLQHWHTGEIYIREFPPSQKNVDTVVIIFDAAHDDRYPLRSTWYAEHENESTLTFYATDPFENMVGPGIARSEYGGLSLLFPPRPVENVFLESPAHLFQSLAEQLTFGALLNSNEREVAFVSAVKPGIRLRQQAARLKKKLVWVPISSFSQETLRKLRNVHILNGRQVRSWASRFIVE